MDGDPGWARAERRRHGDGVALAFSLEDFIAGAPTGRRRRAIALDDVQPAQPGYRVPSTSSVHSQWPFSTRPSSGFWPGDRSNVTSATCGGGPTSTAAAREAAQLAESRHRAPRGRRRARARAAGARSARGIARNIGDDEERDPAPRALRRRKSREHRRRARAPGLAVAAPNRFSRRRRSAILTDDTTSFLRSRTWRSFAQLRDEARSCQIGRPRRPLRRRHERTPRRPARPCRSPQPAASRLVAARCAESPPRVERARPPRARRRASPQARRLRAAARRRAATVGAPFERREPRVARGPGRAPRGARPATSASASPLVAPPPPPPPCRRRRRPAARLVGDAASLRVRAMLESSVEGRASARRRARERRSTEHMRQPGSARPPRLRRRLRSRRRPAPRTARRALGGVGPRGGASRRRSSRSRGQALLRLVRRAATPPDAGACASRRARFRNAPPAAPTPRRLATSDERARERRLGFPARLRRPLAAHKNFSPPSPQRPLVEADAVC